MLLDAADSALLWDMIRHAEIGIHFVEGMSIEQYLSDIRTRFAVERAVEIIGEAANELSEHAKALAPAIPWRKIVSQRNVIAHDYGGIDHLRLWEVVTQRLPEMVIELRRLLSRAAVVENDEAS